MEATIEISVYKPTEDEIRRLSEEERIYVSRVRNLCKRFLMDYLKFYKSSDKKGANQIYREWGLFMREMENKLKPCASEIVYKFEGSVRDVIKGMAKKDSELVSTNR